MTKKKNINYLVVVGGIAGLLLGATQLGYNLIGEGIVAFIALLAGIALLGQNLMKVKKVADLDWTVAVAAAVYIAHYFTPLGKVWQGYDLHASFMTSAAILGLILLVTRWEK